MNYITVSEASRKWGVSQRQVQNLCKSGKVDGAIRFNKSWAIPENIKRPYQRTSVMKANWDKVNKTKSNDIILDESLNVFKEIIDSFPFKITISNTDGIMVYANSAFMEGTLDGVRKSAIGNYNIKREKLLDKWGLNEHIQKAFNGERVYTPNVKFPSKDLAGVKYDLRFAFEIIYQDIYSFPIFNQSGELLYVISTFIPKKRYKARNEIEIGRDYIETNWREPFNAKLVAKAANLSLSRFRYLFNENTGFSPHDYYLNVKMRHIKEKLLDDTLSISQAFNECGIDYNSYYSKLFKKIVGYMPMQFKKKSRDINNQQ